MAIPRCDGPTAQRRVTSRIFALAVLDELISPEIPNTEARKRNGQMALANDD